MPETETDLPEIDHIRQNLDFRQGWPRFSSGREKNDAKRNSRGGSCPPGPRTKVKAMSREFISEKKRCKVNSHSNNFSFTPLVRSGLIFKGEFTFFFIRELDVPPLGESNLMGPKKSVEVKFFTVAFFGGCRASSNGARRHH